MAKKKRKPRTPPPLRTRARETGSARTVQAPQVRKKQRDPAVRERTIRYGLYGLGAAAVVAAVVALVVVFAAGGGTSKSDLSVNWNGLPGVSHGNAPWPAEINNLLPRLHAIGVPELPQQGTALHIHQHLDIFINGKHVAVPALVGINPPPDLFFAALHTHQGESGIIHVESATQRRFSLGEFFAVWGVYLTKKCIGGYCAKPGTPLKFYVDGRPYTGNPVTLVLKEHQEIAIVYGKPPKKIPSSFNFSKLQL